MTRKRTGGTEQLDEYIERVTWRDTDVLRRLRHETERHPRNRMLSNPVQGQLMALLVKAIGARRALEVGTFTGYSALSVALALPPNGKIVYEYTALDPSKHVENTMAAVTKLQAEK